MRYVENPDDFFAPRPKVSLCVRIMRSIILLMVIVISIPVFVLEVLLVYSQTTGTSITNSIMVLATATIVQILLLIPCWRGWMLRRWACNLLVYSLLALAAEATEFSPLLALFVLLLDVLLLFGMRGELSNLKSGF